MSDNTTIPQEITEQSTIKLNEAVKAFSFTHAKNYFGVPLAVASSEPTDEVISSTLVDLPERARNGAEALNLITRSGDLTKLGETIVETITTETTISGELQTFESLKGTTERFIDVAPRYWHPIVQHVLKQHPITGNVVTLLESTGPVTLTELTQVAVRTDHPVKEMLLRNPETFDPVDEEKRGSESESFSTPEVYTGAAVYQFKNLLFHCGIITERGADTSALIPDQDVWALEPALISLGGDV